MAAAKPPIIVKKKKKKKNVLSSPGKNINIFGAVSAKKKHKADLEDIRRFFE